MNNFWKAAFLLGVFVAAAQCLTCYKCSDGKDKTCMLSKKVTCDSTQSCYTEESKETSTTDATGQVTYYIRGCMKSDQCEKKLKGSSLRTSYSSDKDVKCCKTDLCNGATSVQLPLTAALCAAVLSSLWGLWE